MLLCLSPEFRSSEHNCGMDPIPFILKLLYNHLRVNTFKGNATFTGIFDQTQYLYQAAFCHVH